MKCILDNESIKHFSRAILTAIKLGDEIFFDSKPDHHIIKTVNQEKTIFYNVKLNGKFFYEYECEDEAECKFKAKSLFLPFRNPTNLEKNVESCSVTIETCSDFANIVIHETNETEVNYELPKIVTNLSTEVCTESQFPDNFTIKIRAFLNIANNFPQTTDYCTMKVSPNDVKFKSFCLQNNGIKTHFTLNSDAFCEYNVNSTIKITFCLKSLKTFLNSVDKQSKCIVYLEGNNYPIYLVIKSAFIESKLILASLDVEDDNQSQINTFLTTSNIISLFEIEEEENVENKVLSDEEETEDNESDKTFTRASTGNSAIIKDSENKKINECSESLSNIEIEQNCEKFEIYNDSNTKLTFEMNSHTQTNYNSNLQDEKKGFESNDDENMEISFEIESNKCRNETDKSDNNEKSERFQCTKISQNSMLISPTSEKPLQKTENEINNQVNEDLDYLESQSMEPTITSQAFDEISCTAGDNTENLNFSLKTNTKNLGTSKNIRNEQTFHLNDKSKASESYSLDAIQTQSENIELSLNFDAQSDIMSNLSTSKEFEFDEELPETDFSASFANSNVSSSIDKARQTEQLIARRNILSNKLDNCPDILNIGEVDDNETLFNSFVQEYRHMLP